MYSLNLAKHRYKFHLQKNNILLNKTEIKHSSHWLKINGPLKRVVAIM